MYKHGPRLAIGPKRHFQHLSVVAADKADALYIMTPWWWDARSSRRGCGDRTTPRAEDEDTTVTDDREFNPLRYPVMFNTPVLLSVESTWLAHVPLAYLMIELARPRVLVELGTHHGDSYCAFCQAVAQLKTPTRCFAVDTWRGDPQAGFYSPQVLERLKTIHDPLFGGFSTLMQMDFDSAVGQFDDASIDLLHLDGHHTYESARHDYETWLPHMSPRGVMLFHDTSARHDPTFGVWRLWEELSAKHPSFEFPHAYGLGVATVGTDPPADVLAFLRYANANADTVRRFFAEMGQRIVAMQVLLKTTQRLAEQWNVLSQWRQMTGQSALPQLDLRQHFGNPEPLGRAIRDAMTQLAQDDLNLRHQLQPAAPKPPPPPTPPPQ